MKWRELSKIAVLAGGVSMLALTGGCSRNRIKAIDLANEGRRAVKVDVETAISKYQQALQLDPSNHRIMWMLAEAYRKKEDWGDMASTLARATQIAPSFANYWFYRGYALIKQAEGGNPDKYQEAKQPLKTCIQKDPNYAECYHFLGEADLWTNDEQGALENYTKAIEHDPHVAYFYPPLAAAYVSLKFYKQAAQVLKQGTHFIQPSHRNNNNLYGMYVLLSDVAQAQGDKMSMLSALQSAKKVAGDNHPEIAFNLGSTYAVLNPPQKEKAVRLLTEFSKRVCRGGRARKYKEQCETTAALIQKLGGKVN